ncbi:prolactin releasing hormone receptor 2b isoform X2 [Takifugu rubripes]|uniref:prolactin releasing hormone receptor 2b isoform X2 n=1 Tax=Takifugu rubripes TaxID=31033 RepID=UPI0011456A0A|nr:prolactin-releasing peptide receptor-like isoform X2 [Takifugu rubripes]
MEGNQSSLAGSSQTDQHINQVAVHNSSANRSSQFADVALLQTFKPLIIPSYVLVVVVGVFGNYLLLYVICRSRKMHNVTNFFIGNLAFSDMLMCVTCVPFTLAYAFNPRGYYATVHPLKKRTSVATCASVLVGIWLLSCGLVGPAILHTYHVEFKGEGFTICEEFWLGQEKERRAYAYSTLLVTYVLPLSAVFVSYLCITVKLRKCVAPGHRSQKQTCAQQARKRKIFRLVALLVSAFALCWLPIHVFNVLRDIDIHLINKRYFLLIQLLCHLCAMSSSCCNPFLYAWLHDRFRAELRKMFKCRHRIGVRSANHCRGSVVL